MPNCVSPRCRRQIDESWAFCPYCGADNRPPDARFEIAPHRHRYQPGSDRCVLCGEAIQTAASRRRRPWRPYYNDSDEESIARGCAWFGWLDWLFWWW